MMNGGQITLHPVALEDESFLLAIYASSRAEEMARVPWSAEQKQAFVSMQFKAQMQHYAAECPRADHDIICLDGKPVGRIYIDRQATKHHILDVTILPEYRNQGAGQTLLRRLQEEAGAVKKPLTIYVENFNPSVRFFERLGFQKDSERGFHLLLKWQARP